MDAMTDRAPSISERLHQAAFDALYRRSLIYNQCWEDPALDRVALDLQPHHDVLVITSAGCNVLDYALCAPRTVLAVDANPRQSALLELKIAGIRALDHDDFFALFGEGRHPDRRGVYERDLRGQLTPFARTWWDRNIDWFAGDGWRDSFYFHGLSGLVARLVKGHIDRKPRLRSAVADLLAARGIDEQRSIYDGRVDPELWTRGVRWAVSRQATMSLLGVPTAQTREVARANQRGVAGFIRDAIAYVFRELPVWSNYFWSVYLRGSYTRDCCPEYLRPSNFAALKSGLVDRIEIHTDTVSGLLAKRERPVDRFVLLDHMDWLGAHQPAALAEEWDLVFRRAAPGARAIWRSAHAEPAHPANVRLPGGGLVGERLAMQRGLAVSLHRRDRVGTYGGFHIADLRA